MQGRCSKTDYSLKHGCEPTTLSTAAIALHHAQQGAVRHLAAYIEVGMLQ